MTSRTQTVMENPRPSISNREAQNERTPTIQDQIRDYRLGSRIRHQAQRILPRRNNGYRRTLESEISPDAELSLSNYRRAQNVPAEVLYQVGWNQSRNRVYQHNSDERILVVRNQQLELPFITEESYNRLRQSGFQHLHIGMIMVRLNTLHRRNAGVNALVVFRDTRWLDDRSIISTMEMDLTRGVQLAYTAPDMMMSIHDFFNNIQLVIQTHGYENWQAGESNLLISRSLIGRLSNDSFTRFNYNIQNVADHLASHGVQAIPGRSHTTAELRGRQWTIRAPEVSQVQNPQEAAIRTRTDGSISVRFKNYAPTKPYEESSKGTAGEDTLSDEEEHALFLSDISGEDDCSYIGDEVPEWIDFYENGEVEVPEIEDITDKEENDDENSEYLEIIKALAALQRDAIPQPSEDGPIWDKSDEAEEENDGLVNPFAKGGGEDRQNFALMAEMEYPKLKKIDWEN